MANEVLNSVAIVGTATVVIVGFSITSLINISNDIDKSYEIYKDVVAANKTFDTWIAEHPLPTIEEKKAAALNASSMFTSRGNVGVAIDYSDNQLCFWDPATSKKSASIGVTIKSKNQNCSTMVPLLEPSGEKTQDTERKNSSDSPANLMGIMGVAGIAMIGTGGAIFGVRKVKATRKRKTKIYRNSERHIDSLMERHDNVRRSWADYELDPIKMLDYPLLSDMKEKSTSDLWLALRQANSLRDSRSNMSTDAFASAYEKAVLSLEHAFEVAEREAKRVRWSNFSVEERKRLTTAKSLLNFVMDTAASEHERHIAYKRLHKELEGLLQLPDATLLAMENSLKKMVLA